MEMTERGHAPGAVAWKAPRWARVVRAAQAGIILIAVGVSWHSRFPADPGWVSPNCRTAFVLVAVFDAAWSLAYIARARITVTRDAVIVRNTLRTHRIPLDSIGAVHGSFMGVVIRPTGARGVCAAATPFSLRAYRHHPQGRSSEIAAAVTAAARASTNLPSNPGGATPRTTPPPLDPNRTPDTRSA